MEAICVATQEGLLGVFIFGGIFGFVLGFIMGLIR
jgi:hypothetical protein